MWRWLEAAALGVGLIADTGGSECDMGATRCWNNTPQVCSTSDPEMGGDYEAIRWRNTDVCTSPQTCIAPPGMDPMCVLSTDPDPLCADTFSYCREDIIVSCASGYRVDAQLCGGSTTDGATDPVFSKCVEAFPGDAVCVPPEAMPNDVCAPAGTSDAASPSRLCVDTLDVTCLAGLAVATRACAVCAQKCFGFLGDICGSDGNCATGFTCQPDSHGDSRCTAACDVTDPNAVQNCEDLFSAGGPPPSWTNIPLGSSRLACIAGFCEWMQ